MCPSWQYPSKHDGTNTVPHLYHFLPVCTGSTGYRSTVQKRYCFSIDFHYWPVPFIRYWTIPFSYKHPIQRHNCTSVLVLPTRYILQSKLNFVCIVSNSNIIMTIRYLSNTVYREYGIGTVPVSTIQQYWNGTVQYGYVYWDVVRYTCTSPGSM